MATSPAWPGPAFLRRKSLKLGLKPHAVNVRGETGRIVRSISRDRGQQTASAIIHKNAGR
jgi:hypothetical protein